MRALAAHNAHSPESLVSDPTPLRALPPRNAHSASPSHAIFQLQARDQLQQLQEVSREAWGDALVAISGEAHGVAWRPWAKALVG